jgi:hypothetical protein
MSLIKKKSNNNKELPDFIWKYIIDNVLYLIESGKVNKVILVGLGHSVYYYRLKRLFPNLKIKVVEHDDMDFRNSPNLRMLPKQDLFYTNLYDKSCLNAIFKGIVEIKNMTLCITNPPWDTKNEIHTKIIACALNNCEYVSYLGPDDFLRTNSNSRHERWRVPLSDKIHSHEPTDVKEVNSMFGLNFYGHTAVMLLSNNTLNNNFDYDSLMGNYNELEKIRAVLIERRESIISKLTPMLNGIPTIKDKLDVFKPRGNFINVATMFGTNKLYGKYFLIKDGCIEDDCPDKGLSWTPTKNSWDKGIFVSSVEEALKIKELFDDELYLLLNSAFTAGNHTGRNALSLLPFISNVSDLHKLGLDQYIDELKALNKDAMQFRAQYDSEI